MMASTTDCKFEEITFKCCRLCLSNTSQSMKIFDQTNKHLNIATVIAQHFWFTVIS